MRGAWRAAACFGLAWLWLVVVGLASAQAQRLTDEGWRAKLDWVDTREAPTTRAFVTFLDPQDRPINPKAVDLVKVSIDEDQQIEIPRDKIALWRDQEEGTDLVLILPATATINKSTQEVVAKAIDEMVKGLRPEDRVALITYGYAVREDVPLGIDKSKLKAAYGEAQFKGVRPFMFSSLDKAITLLQTSPEGRKRAVLFVGDGTDASNVVGEALSDKVHDLVKRARESQVQIWTLGFDPDGLSKNRTRSLRLIARKTGATYRPAQNQRELGQRFDHVIGEIIGQLVLTFDGKYEPGQTYTFKADVQAFKMREAAQTKAYKAPVEQVKFNWLLWGIICGLTCVVTVTVTVGTVVAVTVSRRRRLRRDAEEALADLLEERPEEADEDKQAPAFVYDEKGQKICNVCGRENHPDWAYCPYDARGDKPLPEWEARKREEAFLLKGEVKQDEAQVEAAKKAAEEAAAQRKKAAEEAQEKARALKAGGKECAKCKRVMDPKWPECLYCASGLKPVE
jgi:hypothetical protein